MTEVQVPVGRLFAVIDEEDLALVEAGPWYLLTTRNGQFYAHNYHQGNGGYMHRLITNAPPGVSVDHRNGDGLDNRRSNLRIAGQSNNMAAATFKPGKSGYRGVHWSSQDGKWRASIKIMGRKKQLGLFNEPLDAALAYDRGAVEAFGEFAWLNAEHHDEVRAWHEQKSSK